MNPTDTPSDPRRRRVSVRRRAAESSSATASAADSAIQAALDRGHRKRLGMAAAPVSVPPASRGGTGTRPPARQTPSVAPRVWGVVRVLVFVAVVAVVWQGVAGLLAARRGTGAARRGTVAAGGACDFAGTVVLDGKPLAQAVIEWHPLDAGPGAAPLAIETDDQGNFARPASHGLAAGRYAVVVKSGCVMPRPGAEFGTPVVIPPRYTRPESTPLQVAVTPSARIDLRVAR